MREKVREPRKCKKVRFASELFDKKFARVNGPLENDFKNIGICLAGLRNLCDTTVR
jgi:hypothetical protein